MEEACYKYSISQRKVCNILSVARSVWCYKKKQNDEDKLKEERTKLAIKYGRYGYRRITAMLKVSGWRINHKKVERIWREEGLKVPKRQKRRRRIYDNDKSCIRHKALWPNHVWSYDFVFDKLYKGKKIKILIIVDEYTRKALCIRVAYNITSDDVMEILTELFILYGSPQFIRSDNGPEFIASELQKWFVKLDVQTAYISPASPWENGYCERFNGAMRDEVLHGEIFSSLCEARAVIAYWHIQYNEIRPHSSLGYRSPNDAAKLADVLT